MSNENKEEIEDFEIESENLMTSNTWYVFKGWDVLKHFLIPQIYFRVESSLSLLQREFAEDDVTIGFVLNKLKSTNDYFSSSKNKSEDYKKNISDSTTIFSILYKDIIDMIFMMVSELYPEEWVLFGLNNAFSLLKNKIFSDTTVDWNNLWNLMGKYWEETIDANFNEMVAINKKIEKVKKNKWEKQNFLIDTIKWEERIMTMDDLLKSIISIIESLPPIKTSGQNIWTDGKTMIIPLNQMMFAWEDALWTKDMCLSKLEAVMKKIVEEQKANKYDSLRILIWWNTIEEKLAKDTNYHKSKRYFLKSVEMALILRYMFHFLKPYFWKVTIFVNNNELEQSERVSPVQEKINWLPSSNYIIGLVLKSLVEKIDWVKNAIYHPNYDIKAVDIIMSNWTIQKFTAANYIKTRNKYASMDVLSESLNWKALTDKVTSIIKFIDSSANEPSLYYSHECYTFLISSFSWIYENKAIITDSSKRQKQKPSSKLEILTQEDDVMTMSLKTVDVPFWTKSNIFNKVIDVTSLENYLEKILNPTWTKIKQLL